MTTALIKKDNAAQTYTYKIRANHYRYFPQSVKTAEDMIAYLTKDGTDKPLLQFVDDKEQPYKHYTVKRSGEYVTAVVDLDTRRTIFVTDSDFWSKEDRLKWLSDQSVENFRSDNVEDALTFLERRDPDVVSSYQNKLKEVRSDYNIRQYFRDHSLKNHNTRAIIDIKE